MRRCGHTTRSGPVCSARRRLAPGAARHDKYLHPSEYRTCTCQRDNHMDNTFTPALLQSFCPSLMHSFTHSYPHTPNASSQLYTSPRAARCALPRTHALLERLPFAFSTSSPRPPPPGPAPRGPADIARHVIGRQLTQETRDQKAMDDVAGIGPGRYCSPRHRMPFNSRNVGSKCVQNELAVVVGIGPGRYCSPRHQMPNNSRNEGSKCGSMTWRAISAKAQPVPQCSPPRGAWQTFLATS